MKKTIAKLILSVSLATVFVTGCSTNPSSSNNFNLMSSESITENQKVGMFANHMNQMGFKALTKDLNLTKEQTDKINALREDGLKKFEANKANRDEIQKVLKDAFLADKVDKTALKAKLDALAPSQDERIDMMAKHIVVIYNILTPEQRVKAEEKINSFEANIEKFRQNFQNKQGTKGKFNKQGMKKDFGMMGMHGGMFGLQNINLTDAQNEQIKTIMTETQPNRDEMINKAKTVKTSILAELKTGNPSVDKIKSILKESKGDIQSHLDKRLDTMIKVHDILTPEQRTQLAQNFENKGKMINKNIKKRVLNK